ncbi:lysine methyltransferase [Nitzschia inconspicua]|uniref:Lysine methyltransferase n=1 Tax=Nitzschia inconspicua TaxID=303405 RepID=A0A9K3KTP3_9STRA|nr:lysine methyltransferase [Nitzschia inconspicua]
MQEETISIQIPEGAEAGDELSFQIQGQELTIPIPLHSQPGDVLQIKLGGRGDESMETEEDTSIQLMTGNQLRLSSSLDDSEALLQPSIADGTYQCLWPASKFVIDYMNTSSTFHHLIRHAAPIRSVLELGAGQGMFGMAFADIVSSLSSSSNVVQVTLSDVEDAMDPLRRNVQINQHLYEGRVHFSIIPLTWHSIPIPNAGCSLDYILGSDLLYNIDNIPDLAATIRRLMSKTTKVLLSVRWRKPVEERSFFVALSDILEWEVLHGTCPLDHTMYGNPACNESNTFFQQTMVGCNGQTLPLSMIDEAGTSQMTAVEFEEYEALQTQVYLGRVKDVTKSGDCHDQKRLKTNC